MVHGGNWLDLVWREVTRGLASGLVELVASHLGPARSTGPASSCPDCVCHCSGVEVNIYFTVLLGGGAVVFFLLGYCCGRSRRSVRREALLRGRDDRVLFNADELR